jgi:hypothetical protein
MSDEQCPVGGCLRKVAPFGRALCRQHWALLPAALKREVWDIGHTNPHTVAFLQARRRAVEAVEAQTGLVLRRRV